jgi:uncharacterized protein YcbK (DUF882 family)
MLPSNNFKREEFACKCGCGFDTVDAQLLEYLDILRNYYDAKVTVTSGCRCPEHNKKVGGSLGSQHLLAKAADIIVEGVSPLRVYEFLDPIVIGGLGKYKTFTHVDSREKRARW